MPAGVKHAIRRVRLGHQQRESGCHRVKRYKGRQIAAEGLGMRIATKGSENQECAKKEIVSREISLLDISVLRNQAGSRPSALPGVGLSWWCAIKQAQRLGRNKAQ
jgi:hypothetical protein